MIKFQFDHFQKYQLDAIESVVQLFDGQPLQQGDYALTLSSNNNFFGQQQTEKGISNLLVLEEEAVYDNVSVIQKDNNVFTNDTPMFHGQNFTIEMETGTGKTYVYLRTMFELSKTYGFKKFIIIVPSVAIREGVKKSIEMLGEELSGLYDNLPFKSFIYDSKRLGEVKNFASGNELQVMIINIDSFNKKTNNVVYKANDSMLGLAPINYIKATNPIVIIDEPQNVESDKAKQSILGLNPLCTLRYSATPKNKYNLLYTFGPVDAFQHQMVKRISVASVYSEEDPNQAYVKLESVSNNKGRIACKLKFHSQDRKGTKVITRTIKQNDDLYELSNQRTIYKNNFIVTEINTRPGMEYVKFANNIRLRLGQENGNKLDVIREQMKITIKQHFDKEAQLQGKGIKVLTLFFLDKVGNYRIYNEDGTSSLGKYAQLFEALYKEISKEYEDLFTTITPVEKVHDGYFSKDKKGKLKDTKGTTKADDDTYALIMQDKERLLDLSTPLKFIFSHSALREGWDNPNVFQICTLNETKSTIKKRQEIGRGLRLPVNQDGERIKDTNINVLTVIANEHYDTFANTLQKEYEEEGIVFGRLPIYAFTEVIYENKDGKEAKITKKESETIWKHFKDKGYIEQDGKITEDLEKAIEDLSFSIPEGIEVNPRTIAEITKSYQITNFVKKSVKKEKVTANKTTLLDPEFKKFWNAISKKTIYRVQFDTKDLISKAALAIAKMDKIYPPRIRTEIADLRIQTTGVEAVKVMEAAGTYTPLATVVPDILTFIQNKTELTRSTIAEILKQSKRLRDFRVNPQKFMDAVATEIQTTMNHIITNGIKYEQLEGVQYEMSLLEKELGNLFLPKNKIVPATKSIQDFIPYDSGIEKTFANALENDTNVKYFIKLPSWFKIDTPVGKYNPDWAIMKKNGEVLYMIRETKGSKNKMQLRYVESDKIQCGREHFKAIEVDYDVTDKWEY